jgi:hypothetical protein
MCNILGIDLISKCGISKKLDLYLSAHATHKDAFLFLSQIPRFNLAPLIILGLITC